MSKQVYFLIIPLVIGLSLVSYKLTYGFFSDSANSLANTFAAASVFPTPTPSGSLLINEVFVAGNSNEEWVEIFNNTLSSIDISGWSIADNTSSDPIPSSTPIPAGGYAVIVSNDSIVSVPLSVIKIQLGSAIGNGFAVGGDNVSLTNPSAVVVDSMNWGSNTDFFSPSISGLVSGSSMARNPNGVDTNTAADWIIDSTPTIGVANP